MAKPSAREVGPAGSHVIIVPKYRKKAIFGSLRKQIGTIRRESGEQGGIEVVEGHGMLDHGPLCLSIPPKDRVATAVGRMKGKSAIRIHRACLGRAQNFTGFHFWATGTCVSTGGFDEQQVLEYILEQEEHEKVEEQLVLQLTQKHTK